MIFPEFNEQIRNLAQRFRKTEQEVEDDALQLLRDIFVLSPHLVTKTGVDILRKNNLVSNKELFKWFFIKYCYTTILILGLLFIAIVVIVLSFALH